MKKTFFILLLAAVLVLTGCSSLVKRDSSVDAKQTILTVNGEHVTKQTFLNVYDYNLYTEQQYAQMMKQFGMSDGSVDSKSVLQSTLQSFISMLVNNQKAAELGFDQFTDEENAALDAEAQADYDDKLKTVKDTYFADSEPTEEELAATAANQGYSLSSSRSSAEQKKINERLKDYAAKDVTVDDAALQATLEEKIDSQKSRYENSANALNSVITGGSQLFYVPAGYRTIRVIQTSGDTAEADINALAERIAAGEAIDALGVDVKEYAVTEGSSLVSADLVTAAMALTEKGSVTAAIQTANGYAIAEYADDVAEYTATLEEVRDSLYDETLENVRTAAYNAAMDSWVNASDIQTYLDRLN